MGKKNKILIVRTDRIGDVVLTLPLANIIKSRYVDSEVHFLVKNYTKPLVELNKLIDKVYTIDELSFLQILKLLRREKYTSIIHVYPVSKLVFAAFFAGIKNRIGTGYRLYSFLLNKKIFEHRKTGSRHELEYNVQLLKEIDINFNPDINNVDFSIQPRLEDVKTIDKILSEKGIKYNLPIIIIHPGSGGSAIDLPLERFVELSTKLAQSLKFNVIITGSKSEKDICEKLVVDKSIINLSGSLTLTELVALINRAEMLVANSTGPIHLAAALKKQVIGFYPKFNECSPKRWGPYTNKKSIFQPEIGCNNCSREQCERLNCMNSIDINKVFNTILNIMNTEN